MTPLTRRDLDHMGCSTPGCTEKHESGITVRARCHLNAPVEAWYRDGLLTFRCKKCSALVVTIAVADGPVMA